MHLEHFSYFAILCSDIAFFVHTVHLCDFIYRKLNKITILSISACHAPL